MNAKNGKTNNKAGFVLFTVLLVLAVLSTMLGMLIHLSGQRAHMAKILTDRVKATAYAEAGVDYAYAILSADFSQRYNESMFNHADPVGGGAGVSSVSSFGSNTTAGAISIGDGSFDITLSIINSNSVLVSSLGTCNSSTKTAEVVVEDFYAGATPDDVNNLKGFEYAMLSGSSLDYNGSGTISNANPGAEVKLHSNNAIDISADIGSDVSISSTISIAVGNGDTVYGNVMAEDVYTKVHSTITGAEKHEYVPPIKVPDIDLTPFFNYANDQGAVYSGLSLSGGTFAPPGGVAWINGDVTISSDTVVIGSIIATGNIHFGGQADLKPTTTSFALASRDGNVTFSSSGRVEGLIYTKVGDFSHTANGTIQGQILIAGSIKKAGNSDILIYQQSIPKPPGDYGIKSLIGISAWQK